MANQRCVTHKDSCNNNFTESVDKRRICILTYQALHKKTMDTLMYLKAYGYKNVHIYARAFQYKKKYVPFVEHRPQFSKNDILYRKGYMDLISNLGYSITEIEDYEEIEEVNGTVFLLCGAGILPQSIVNKYVIINVHPGYIPNCRGLDALKWAIYEDEPIGVTTHLLGEYVDGGEIIERRKIPVFQFDTFHAVAQRVYDNEISMLVEAIEKSKEGTTLILPGKSVLHKRMPNELEGELFEKFEEYKVRHAIQNRKNY